ncbi:hypothetical protein BST61_g477 [Cercospora zeina]
MALPSDTSATAQRCIRAHFDEDNITVFQAYNSHIAEAAVSAQRLDASPQYAPKRATWIKPSWNWMMYRSGYASKDKNQACILALKMEHENFIKLLEHAVIASEPHSKGQSVVIQWDPERGPRLEKLDYRSIQIGIPGTVREQWIREWISSIEDVTKRAEKMKSVLDREGDVDGKDLLARGLAPEERVYVVPEYVRERIGMGID